MRYVVALACLLACKREPDPAPPPAARPRPVDAAVADTVAIDAAAKQPDFGCLAWSSARGLVACVVGQSTVNVMATELRLEFHATREGVTEPDPITLISLREDEGRGPGELPPDAAAQLAAALRGFAPVVPGAAIHGDSNRDKLVVGPPITVAGRTIAAKLVMTSPPIADAEGIPAVYHLVVSARDSRGAQVLDDVTAPLMGVDIRAFALGDTVIVDEVYYTGEEGAYGTFGNAWRLK